MIGIPKPTRILDAKYRKWIKSQPCLIAQWHKCDGPIDAHHVIPDGGGKIGSKVSDYRCVPLCRVAHDDVTRLGRNWFQAAYPVVFEYEIGKLNLKYFVEKRVQPARPIRKQPQKVTLRIYNCAGCGRTHEIPKAKIDTIATVEFTCDHTSKRIRAI